MNRTVQLLENGSSVLASATYDDHGRPSGLDRTNGAGTAYGYDPLSRLEYLSHNVSGTGDDVDYNFAYNPASQISSRSTSNEDYLYSSYSNATKSYSVNGLNQYTGVGGATFSYDPNGNLISDGLTTYSYDIENRLRTASGGTTATLKYDPMGRLYEVSGGGSNTRFLYDGDALVAEYDLSGTLTRRYVHGSGVDVPLIEYVGSSVNSSSRQNLYSDHLGSITALTNAAGSVVSINQYDSYGIPEPTNTGRFGFTGQAYIAEIELNYYKARMYSPALGRFLQTDPIGYEDQMNLYGYVGNDPMNSVDPTGKCSAAAGIAALGTSAADGPLPVGEAVGAAIIVGNCAHRLYKFIHAVTFPSTDEAASDFDADQEIDSEEEFDDDEYWEDQFPDEKDRKKNRERRNRERSERPNDPEEKELRQRENEDAKARTGRGGDDPAPDEDNF